jgi:hypothetical protein
MDQGLGMIEDSKGRQISPASDGQLGADTFFTDRTIQSVRRVFPARPEESPRDRVVRDSPDFVEPPHVVAKMNDLQLGSGPEWIQLPMRTPGFGMSA